jgi:hypothetical protein
MGNDLVRFIDTVIGRPTYVSGLSSGGVLSAWLSAYAKPGQVIAALFEDPPLFASELRPAMGPGIRQCIGPMFDLWSTYLGDQWSIGAWDAMREGAPDRLPEWLKGIPVPEEPPQNLKEYDPEWGRSFWTGTVAASCDHERMLRSVKVPVLLGGAALTRDYAEEELAQLYKGPLLYCKDAFDGLHMMDFISTGQTQAAYDQQRQRAEKRKRLRETAVKPSSPAAASTNPTAPPAATGSESSWLVALSTTPRATRRRCARSWPGTPRRSPGWCRRSATNAPKPSVDITRLRYLWIIRGTVLRVTVFPSILVCML